MKKLLLLIVVFLLPILITGCQQNKEKTLIHKSNKGDLPSSINKENTKFIMYLNKSKYSLPINEIILEVKNLGSTNIEFGDNYYVEKYQNNLWYEIPFKENVGFNDILHILESHKTYKQKIYLESLDYHLLKGKYRIVKGYSSNGKKITLAAEFDIF